jgi:hypothetical protein
MNPKFKPGSFGCHEALHVARLMAGMVERELCEHPAIIANDEWRAKADKACDLLGELYQDIGRKHL